MSRNTINVGPYLVDLERQVIQIYERSYGNDVYYRTIYDHKKDHFEDIIQLMEKMISHGRAEKLDEIKKVLNIRD